MDLNEQTGLTLQDVALAIVPRAPASLRAYQGYDVYYGHEYAVKLGIAALIGLPWIKPGHVPGTYSITLKNGGNPKSVVPEAWIYLDLELRPSGWDLEKAFRNTYKLADKNLDQMFAVGTPTLTVKKAVELLTEAASAVTPLVVKHRMLQAAHQEVAHLLSEVAELRKDQATRDAIRRNMRTGQPKDIVHMLKSITMEDLIAAFEADEA